MCVFGADSSTSSLSESLSLKSANPSWAMCRSACCDKSCIVRKSGKVTPEAVAPPVLVDGTGTSLIGDCLVRRAHSCWLSAWTPFRPLVSDFTTPSREARVASIVLCSSSSIGCEGKAVSSSTTETSGNCSAQEDLFPSFPNVCSESASYTQYNDEFYPWLTEIKTTRGRKTMWPVRVIETEIQYSMQCKIMPMNSECVACGCQLIPLSGSVQRETITNTDYLQNSRAHRGK